MIRVRNSGRRLFISHTLSSLDRWRECEFTICIAQSNRDLIIIQYTMIVSDSRSLYTSLLLCLPSLPRTPYFLGLGKTVDCRTGAIIYLRGFNYVRGIRKRARNNKKFFAETKEVATRNSPHLFQHKGYPDELQIWRLFLEFFVLSGLRNDSIVGTYPIGSQVQFADGISEYPGLRDWFYDDERRS